MVGAENLHEALVQASAPQSLLAGAPPVVLRPMSQQEMIEYIDFRMKSVGGLGSFTLDTASRQARASYRIRPTCASLRRTSGPPLKNRKKGAPVCGSAH